MAFDVPDRESPIPKSFGDVYSLWRGLHPEAPLLAFVRWVETTLERPITDLGTVEDMEALRRALSTLPDRATEASDMLWEGLEGGP